MARTYGDRCGVARALDLVGERWALLVVRELLLGPKRFTDLRAGLPQVGPDVLSQRLRELEGAGIVARSVREVPLSSTSSTSVTRSSLTTRSENSGDASGAFATTTRPSWL